MCKKKVKNAIVNIELSSYWFVNMTGYTDQKSKHVRKFSLKVWRNWEPNLLFKKNVCSPLSKPKLKYLKYIIWNMLINKLFLEIYE